MTFGYLSGFVVINTDGIPTKWHESMPYERHPSECCRRDDPHWRIRSCCIFTHIINLQSENRIMIYTYKNVKRNT